MSGVQANLLLAGVQNASPWLSTDELQAPAKLAMVQQRNALLNRMDEQTLASQDMEMIARASAYLETLPDTAARQAAYPGVVSQLQQSGFAKNAPSVYPGDERISQLARMGTPSKELLTLSENRRTGQALLGTGATPAAPATTGSTVAAPGSYEGAIGGHEGTGQNPRSTAYGTGQFLESTWLQFAAANPEMFPNMSQQQILAARSNPALGNTAINWLAQKNAQDLQAAGVAPSGQSLGIAHYLGSGAAAKIMSAGDAEPVRNFVSEAAVRANPELANMTAGQMKARYAGTPNPSFMTASTTTPGGQRVQVAAATPTTMTDGTTARPTGGSGGVVATDGTTTAAPAQPPPAAATAAVPGLLQLDQRGLTANDRSELGALVQSGRLAPTDLAAAIQQRSTANNAHNNQAITQARAARGEERQIATAAQTAANEAERIRLAQEDAARKQREEQIAIEKAKRDAMFTGAPEGQQWADDGKGGRTLITSPGYQGKDAPERVIYRLENGDPNSAQYASDYAARKWQVAPGSGNVIENDMSMFRPPSQPIQRPTYLPQPTAASLDKVREITADSTNTVQAIDHYLDVLKSTDGATFGAFMNNPRDPKAQRLLGAFIAMKIPMRGPAAMNTGVLQPAEMEMLKEDLVSPQTVRGFGGTFEATQARLHEVKLSLLRKADVENRSVGKPGIIMRSDSEVAPLPSGTQFYDKDGNLRIKP